MTEIWKDIKGYEGLYKVSNFGEVMSVDKTFNNRFFKSKLMAKQMSTGGYYAISSNHPRLKKKSLRIHQLVAKHFLDNPNHYPAINHMDGNKLNNHVSNLEWCTFKHNINHAFRIGLCKKGELHVKSKLVVDVNTGVYYFSVREVANLYGLNEMVLYNRLSNLRPNKTQFIFA